MSQKGTVVQLLLLLGGASYHAEPSVTWAQSSCPWSTDHRELAMKPQVQAGKEKVTQQKRGILATSWNLLVPSELLGKLFQ